MVVKGREKQFIDALLPFLSNLPNWDEMILENISCESPIPDLLKTAAAQNHLGFQIIRRAPSILIKLPNTWDDYLKSIGKNLRYKINRGRREFEKRNGYYHLLDNELDIPEAYRCIRLVYRGSFPRIQALEGLSEVIKDNLPNTVRVLD